MQNTKAPRRDASGRIVGLVGVARDITDRKRAEEALRESEARFRSVLESSRDVIYRLNLQTGRYEYISPAAATVVGFSVEELMAQDIETALAMVHPADVPAMRAALARTFGDRRSERGVSPAKQGRRLPLALQSDVPDQG